MSTFLVEVNPDVFIWCLLSKEQESSIISNGLSGVVNYAKDNQAKVIYVSSDVFGDGIGNYTEDTPLIPISSKNPLAGYANAKLEGEKLVTQLKKYIIVRTGPIYGQNINM